MGEVRQVVVGGTVKVLESEMSATERAKAGMDNYSSPQNLRGEIQVKIYLFTAVNVCLKIMVEVFDEVVRRKMKDFLKTH